MCGLNAYNKQESVDDILYMKIMSKYLLKWINEHIHRQMVAATCGRDNYTFIFTMHRKNIRNVSSKLTRNIHHRVHNLISVQSTGETRPSSVVTLTRPSVSSSLQIINRSFTYASPHMWNQLPSSFRQPHSVHSPSGSTSSCVYHVITVTTFALITYHCLYLSLQT